MFRRAFYISKNNTYFRNINRIGNMKQIQEELYDLFVMEGLIPDVLRPRSAL